MIVSQLPPEATMQQAVRERDRSFEGVFEEVRLSPGAQELSHSWVTAAEPQVIRLNRPN